MSVSSSITVCSHNVLAEKWFDWQRNGGHGYTKIPADHPIVDFEYRFKFLSAYLEEKNADIYCLQEMELSVFEQHYVPFFDALGYDGVFQKTKNKYPIATASFWRRARFTNDWQEFRSRTMLLSLRDRENDCKLYIVNCHLEGNKPGVYKGEQRVNQLKSTFARLEKQVVACGESVDAARIIVAGDLNALPGEEIHTLLTKGELKAGHVTNCGQDTFVGQLESTLLKDAQQPFRFQSCMRSALGREPCFSFVGKNHAFPLDYIYSQNFHVTSAIDTSSQYSSSDIEAMLGAIPNEKIPSDHLAIRATLHFALDEAEQQRQLEKAQKVQLNATHDEANEAPEK